MKYLYSILIIFVFIYFVKEGVNTETEGVLVFFLVISLMINAVLSYLVTKWGKANYKIIKQHDQRLKERNEYEAKAANYRYSLIELVNNPSSIWSEETRRTFKDLKQ